MNIQELKATRQALQSQLRIYEHIKPGCETCEHFAHKQCQHFSATPPDEWVTGAVECPEWVYDSIPF